VEGVGVETVGVPAKELKTEHGKKSEASPMSALANWRSGASTGHARRDRRSGKSKEMTGSRRNKVSSRQKHSARNSKQSTRNLTRNNGNS